MHGVIFVFFSSMSIKHGNLLNLENDTVEKHQPIPSLRPG